MILKDIGKTIGNCLCVCTKRSNKTKVGACQMMSELPYRGCEEIIFFVIQYTYLLFITVYYNLASNFDAFIAIILNYDQRHRSIILRFCN